MASNLALPTIRELLDAFAAGATSRHEDADVHSGSIYDVPAGMGALLWSRVAARDREVFRAIYLDGCQGSALDNRVSRFGGPARVGPSKGVGTVSVSFDLYNLGYSPGTFLTGTRIAVYNGTSVQYVRLTEDRSVDNAEFANAESVGPTLTITLPIEANENAVAVDSSKMPIGLKWEDLIYDPGWQIVALQCSASLPGETDTEYRARFRAWKKSRKTGYGDAITRKMLECGASKVALFESDFIEGEDHGINRVFVAGGGFATSQTLLDSCRQALDSCIPYGNTTTVGSMSLTPIEVTATLRMSRDASRYNTGQVSTAATQAVKRALSGSQSAYVFRRDSLGSELTRALPDLQQIVYSGATPIDTDVVNIVRLGAGGNLTIYDAQNVTVHTTIEGT